MKSLTAVLYLRVSTADQGRYGFSLPEQRLACLEHARRLADQACRATGCEPDLQIAEFVDTVGGDILERPELDKVREFVRRHRPDFFICLDPDRFSRETLHALLVVAEIEQAGTRMEFVQHEYSRSAEGQLFFTLRVGIAKFEKMKILERTARGRRGAMRAGQIPHGLRVYGYRYVPAAERERRRQENGSDLGPLEPMPEEAHWVRQIFEWAADEGLGPERIAQRLNQLQVPTKQNAPAWRRGVVGRILRNRTYDGHHVQNRLDATGLGGQQQLPPDRRTRRLTARQRPREEWIVTPVPALLPPGLFERVQQLRRVLPAVPGLAATQTAVPGLQATPTAAPDPPPATVTSSPDQGSTRPARGGHLLSGLAVCGLCGAPMHYAFSHKVQGYYLRCPHRNAPSGCSMRSHRAASIEARVWGTVMAWLTDPAVLQPLPVFTRVQVGDPASLRPAAAEQRPDEARLTCAQRQIVLRKLLREVRLFSDGRVGLASR